MMNMLLGFALGCGATFVVLYVIGVLRQRNSFTRGTNSVVNHGENVEAILEKEGGSRYAHKGK